MEQKIAAILVADVADYTRLMESDERGIHRLLKKHLEELFIPEVKKHNGRVVKLMGDGVLAEYSSVVGAVKSAVNIQRGMQERNVGVDNDHRISFRIGINLDDVIVDGDDIFGDGVNLAARLEGVTQSGDITISGSVYEQVKRKLDYPFEYLGAERFKNISRPVEIYSIPTGSNTKRNNSQSRATGVPAIVVMPFRNLSNDSEQEYFCEGLTKHISTELSKFSNLFVIASSSAFAYKEQRKTAQQIGNELNVRYILEGAVQRSENKIRVNAELVDSKTGHHLRARRFDKDFSDVFDIQEEVIELIVGALVPKLTVAERLRATRRSTENINAYDAFLRGAHHLSTHLDVMSHSDEALLESRRWFERAIELDPVFARAWGWLGYSHAVGWTEGWSDETALETAKDCVEKAVTMEAEDYDNFWALAYVCQTRGNVDKALNAYAQAFKLNRNDPDMLVEMAEALCCAGQHDEASLQIERAIEINPRHPDWYLWTAGWVDYHKKDYNVAVNKLQQIVSPNNEVRLIIAASYAQLGDDQSAQMFMRKFINQRPDWTIEKEIATTTYRNHQDKEHWLQGIRKAGLPE